MHFERKREGSRWCKESLQVVLGRQEGRREHWGTRDSDCSPALRKFWPDVMKPIGSPTSGRSGPYSVLSSGGGWDEPVGSKALTQHDGRCTAQQLGLLVTHPPYHTGPEWHIFRATTLPLWSLLSGAGERHSRIIT